MLKSKTLIAAMSFAALSSLAFADVTIGVNGPFSGQLASFGEQFKRGAMMAEKDLNKAGGINGQKVKVAFGDDQCDPKQAVNVANKAVNDKVTAIIGHFCSGSSIPASDVYKEEGLIQISPASTNPKFTERGYNNVFRVCGRDDQQGAVAGAYIAKHFKGKKVAILHDKTAYGQGLAEETQKSLGKEGMKEVMFEAFTPGEKDYSALVSKLKASGVDMVYLGGYHPEAGLIIKQLREQGSKAVLMSGDALNDKEFWKIAGSAGEGTLFTFSPDPRKDPANKDLIARFKAENYDPEGYTLYTYASFQIYADAAKTAKSLKSADVEKVMRDKTFNTAIGKVSFDAKGDPKHPGYVVYSWKNGEYDYVK